MEQKMKIIQPYRIGYNEGSGSDVLTKTWIFSDIVAFWVGHESPGFYNANNGTLSNPSEILHTFNVLNDYEDITIRIHGILYNDIKRETFAKEYARNYRAYVNGYFYQVKTKSVAEYLRRILPKDTELALFNHNFNNTRLCENCGTELFSEMSLCWACEHGV